MDVYFDSAIVVKLYVREATSPDAIRLVAGYTAPYALSFWQTLEVKNAIRLKAFRREITPIEMSQSLAAFDEDIASGRWLRPNYRVEEVEAKTEELSNRHSATLGCQTLDVIHVAVALLIEAEAFVTFDQRQAALARAEGLVVKP